MLGDIGEWIAMLLAYLGIDGSLSSWLRVAAVYIVIAAVFVLFARDGRRRRERLGLMIGIPILVALLVFARQGLNWVTAQMS